MAAKDEKFRRLFEQYYEDVARFFARRNFPREIALELAQETFLRVYRGMDSYREDAKARTWIMAIATNLLSNVRRHDHAKDRHLEVKPQDFPETEQNPVRETADTAYSGPFERLSDLERRLRLRRAILTLPPRMRQAIVLRIVHELKYREIADVLGITIETVKTLLYQAKLRLKESLGLRGDASPEDEGD